MEFVKFPAAEARLGLDPSRLPAKALAELDAFFGDDAWRDRLGAPRTVELDSFAIARSTMPIADLIGNPYALPVEIDSLSAVCAHVDALLAEEGLRLPTEDELEAACGGGIFFWGDELPEGSPSRTDFAPLKGPMPTGLRVDGDTYQVELARTAFMLGDGGEAVCGAYPWPTAWLCLSPAWRLRDDDVGDVLLEFLEGTHVRPVRPTSG